MPNCLTFLLLQKLVRSEVCVSSNVLSFSGYNAFGTDDKGLKALALVIKVGNYLFLRSGRE